MYKRGHWLLKTVHVRNFKLIFPLFQIIKFSKMLGYQMTLKQRAMKNLKTIREIILLTRFTLTLEHKEETNMRSLFAITKH